MINPPPSPPSSATSAPVARTSPSASLKAAVPHPPPVHAPRLPAPAPEINQEDL
jgi:hypothetical protein